MATYEVTKMMRLTWNFIYDELVHFDFSISQLIHYWWGFKSSMEAAPPNQNWNKLNPNFTFGRIRQCGVWAWPDACSTVSRNSPETKGKPTTETPIDSDEMQCTDSCPSNTYNPTWRYHLPESKKAHKDIHTCPRSDADETCDHPLYGSNDRRLPEERHIQACPHQKARGRTHVRVQHRHRRRQVSSVRRAAVKSRPPHP